MTGTIWEVAAVDRVARQSVIMTFRKYCDQNYINNFQAATPKASQ